MYRCNFKSISGCTKKVICDYDFSWVSDGFIIADTIYIWYISYILRWLFIPSIYLLDYLQDSSPKYVSRCVFLFNAISKLRVDKTTKKNTAIVIHYGDVIMGTMASQITSLTIVYSTAYSGADQRKHQSSASLAFVRGIHRCTVNSPHTEPVTRKMFPFHDVIIVSCV